MTLTITQMYDRYSVREFCRKIEIKRRNIDGTYESDWQDVVDLTGLELLEKSAASINFSIANNSYNFGIVTSGNVMINLNSKNGQFDDEINSGSVFKGFIRHKSLIRVKDGYVDNYTTPSAPVPVYKVVFQGFIDGIGTATKVDDENFKQTLQCLDLLSFLLKQYTVADVSTLTSTTFNDVVYEIMNRSEFTDFFSVDVANISAGYNATSIDMSQYEEQTQLFTVFENISVGHSFFYVKNDVFYYKPVNSGNPTSFAVNAKKLIKFSQFNNGISNIFELFYWTDEPTIKFVASDNTYNRSQTIDVKCVTNNTQRQNLIDVIGSVGKLKKREFLLEIPYFMDIFILDEIKVESPSIIPDDAFIWGISKWGEGKRWRKSLQADSIPNNATWLVRDVKHSNFKTKIKMQEIL